MDGVARRRAVLSTSPVHSIHDNEQAEKEEEEDGWSEPVIRRSMEDASPVDVLGIGRHRSSVKLPFLPDREEGVVDDSASSESSETSETFFVGDADDGLTPQELCSSPHFGLFLEASPSRARRSNEASPPRMRNPMSDTPMSRFGTPSSKERLIERKMTSFNRQNTRKSLDGKADNIVYGGIAADFMMRVYLHQNTGKIEKRTRRRSSAGRRGSTLGRVGVAKGLNISSDELVRWYRKKFTDVDSDSLSDDESDTDSETSNSDVEKMKDEKKLVVNEDVMAALKIVTRDRVVQTLQREIVEFWKECEKSDKAQIDRQRRKSRFVVTGKGHFFGKASEVLKERKESRCLECELNNLMLMRNLLHGPKAHTTEEDLDEKLRTQKTFWKLFHAEEHVRTAMGASRGRPGCKAILGATSAKPSSMFDSCTSFFSTTSTSIFPSEDNKAKLPLLAGSTHRGSITSGAYQTYSSSGSQGKQRPGSNLGFGQVPFGSRPQSKQQRPGSRAHRTDVGWRPSTQTTMNKSKSAMSTRMVVTHRKDVHQQRVKKSEQMANSAGFTLNSSTRSQANFDTISSPSAKVDLLSSSSEEDDGELDEWLNGGYLDPNYRKNRGKKIFDTKAPVYKPAGYSVSPNLLERHLNPPKRWLPPLAKSASEGTLPVELPDLLPPVFQITNPVASPWQTTGKIKGPQLRALETCPENAAVQYIEICCEKGIVPTPFALEMVNRSELLAAGKQLQDLDLAALTVMVPLMSKLGVVDLSGNALLGDDALARFLDSCYGWPVAGSLQKLSLESCKGLGRSSTNKIVDLLSNSDVGLYSLLHLNLSGIFIPNASLSPLCSAIRKHGSLKQLHMADTGLGLNPSARQCMAELFLAPELEDLNLGWNSFAVDVFQVIGASVCAHEKLRNLTLASCSGSRTASGEAPISTFLEQLSHDSGLTKLDVSLNQVDARCALVLEDALENHKELTDLCISQNSLGVDGMRCFLRLLSRNSSGLLQFDSSGCCSCNGKDSVESSFKPTHLSGRYDIDLNFPSGRALLRMLYKSCERMNIKPEIAFSDLDYTNPKAKLAARAAAKRQAAPAKVAYHHPSKNEFGVWCVPTSGVLHTTFSINEALFNIIRVEDDDGNCLPGIAHGIYESSLVNTLQDKQMPPMLGGNYITKYLDTVRLRPGFRKIVPLLMQFRSLKGDHDEQEFLIDALSHDFILKFAHIEQFYISKSANVNVLSKLLQCLPDPHERFMALSLTKSLVEYNKVYSDCAKLLNLNLENATGHYNLDLSVSSDYRIYQTMVVLDDWEAMSAKRRGIADMSMENTWSGIRNAFYQNCHVASIKEVRFPSRHHLHFDYSSFRRPPLKCSAISDDCWHRVLLQLETSKCKKHDKVIAVRAISPQVYIRSVQLRELLGSFYCTRDRTNIVTSFVFRLTDPQNMKIFSARLGDFAERFAMIQRLGTLAMFPYFQPEEAILSLNLATYEGRLATSLAVHLARQENVRNIRQPSLLRTDGTYFDFIMGIPLSWEHLESVPTSGLFQFRYVCSPEERKVHLRSRLAAKYGGWRTLEDGHDHVVWWSSLSEAPEAVLTFLYYTLRDFPDVWSCFKTVESHGSTAPHSFKEALKQMGWKKFVKHQNLAMKVFRYLDPDNSGTISRVEWSALHQLWKELQLSILEFLQYLDRHFAGNFHMAWSVLDADGSGAIDRQEWAEVIALIGYFGESTPIFNYICSHKGLITSDGWKKLKTLWTQRVELRRLIFLTNVV